MNIKQQLNIRQVVEFYGYKVNRAGFIKCPIHNEKTPSMKVYDNNKGFFCFGCNAGGTVIDFVMKLYQMDFKTAVNKLKNDFGITDKGVDYRRLKKASDLNKAKEQIQKKKEHLADIEFRTLWLRHKELRHLPPHEDFWDNLDKLLKLEDFKYNGL